MKISDTEQVSISKKRDMMFCRSSKIMPEAGDGFILQKARQENRILVTLDKDFGQLIYQQSKRHVGVIFLRIRKESAENITDLIMKVLFDHGDQLSNKFIVASEMKIRIR